MADAILGPDVDMYEEEEEEEFDDEEFDEDEEGEFDDEEGEEFDDEEIEEEEPVPSFIITGSATRPADLLSELGDVSVAQGELQEVETPSREDIDITVDVLQHILQYMNIHAMVQVRSNNPLTLNIQGINENLGLLIGRPGKRWPRCSYWSA